MLKHGKVRTPEYRAWASMKKRCLTPTSHNYHLYGGRGISVCPEWIDSFEVFYRDMGPRPSYEHSLDRINNNGHYSKENCRWATKSEQSTNRRSTQFVTAFGETKCLSRWSEEFGVPFNTLSRRVKDGWHPEVALTRPSLKGKGGLKTQIDREFLYILHQDESYTTMELTPALKKTMEQIAAACVTQQLDINVALAGILAIGLAQTNFIQGSGKAEILEEVDKYDNSSDIEVVQ